MKTTLGTVSLEDTERVERVRGRPITGPLTDGTRHTFAVTDIAGLDLQLGYTEWDSGEHDIRAVRSSGPPQIVHNLKPEWLRMGVTVLEGGLRVALLQARVKLNTELLDASLYPASVEQLNGGSGVAIANTFGEHGASVVKASAGRIHIHLPVGARVAAAAAFVVARVLPLKNMYWAKHTNVDPGSFGLAGLTDPAGRRRYVIALDKPATQESLGSVYVGDTAKLIPYRFRQHKLGYRASRHVRDHGVRLMPELYEHLPPVKAQEEARQAENDLAAHLRSEGYTVFGGH